MSWVIGTAVSEIILRHEIRRGTRLTACASIWLKTAEIRNCRLLSWRLILPGFLKPESFGISR